VQGEAELAKQKAAPEVEALARGERAGRELQRVAHGRQLLCDTLSSRRSPAAADHVSWRGPRLLIRRRIDSHFAQSALRPRSPTRHAAKTARGHHRGAPGYGCAEREANLRNSRSAPA
jgi:hypothetical protein